MLKKISCLLLVCMLILSMGPITINANAIIVDENIENMKMEKAESNHGDDQDSISETTEIIEWDILEENTVEEKDKRIIDPDKPMIALTYDDGPSQYTEEILDVLKENNSLATFFVLGSRVYDNNEILNRMLEEGNQIGNHSYNHKDLTSISNEELYRQIKGTDDLIYIATGYTPTVMRPPYGSTNDQVNESIPKPIIHWSIDTLDWKNRDSEIIVQSILEDVKDGDIVLMHDLYESTGEASKIVIPELIDRGYQLVTIDELFEYRETTLAAGEQYYRVYK